MRSRDPVGEDRFHKRTDAIAALTAFSHAVRTRDRIDSVCSTAGELPPGCRPCLQRCAVIVRQTSRGLSALRFCHTASATLCTKSFRERSCCPPPRSHELCDHAGSCGMLQVRVLWPPFCAGFSHSSSWFSSAAFSCPLSGCGLWHRSSLYSPRASGGPCFSEAVGCSVRSERVPRRTPRGSLPPRGEKARSWMGPGLRQ